MGFCRRCGDIVVGAKCKCGGTAVDPVVQWNVGNNSKVDVSDRWSQTYVSRDKSPDRRSASHGPSADIPAATTEPRTTRSVSPTKRFPRPNSTSSFQSSQPLAPRVITHITSTTSQRPRSPLKYSTSDPESPTSRAAFGIIPSLDKAELSKAYGSVLQSKESLNSHCCAACSATFPPDATIYPDPHAAYTSNRFLCRPCFITNGGSKGDCPECHRAVLILKNEGGFVENSGRFWHKRCFRCEACSKSIGENPMVDLLGRPCCADCFDTCLERSPGRDSAKSSPRRPFDTPGTREKSGNIGGHIGDRKSREGSPAIEELEQRLGIIKSRESSPALDELSQRMSAITMKTPTKDSPSRTQRPGYPSSRDNSPLVDLAERRERAKSISSIMSSPFTSPGAKAPEKAPQSQRSSVLSGSPSQIVYERFASPEREIKAESTGKDDAVEQMKQRFLKHAASSSSLSSNAAASRSPVAERSRQSSPAVKAPTPTKPMSRIPVSTSRHGSPSLRNSFSTSSISSSARSSYMETDSSILSTPDMTSEFSDSQTESSLSSSPPNIVPSYEDDVFTSSQRIYSSSDNTDDDEDKEDTFNKRRTPTPKSKAKTLPSGMSARSCGACGGALFTKQGSGKFVTVPEDSRTGGASSKTYHTECFRCRICQGPFKETGTGQAIFVRAEQGACHPECAPPEKIKTWSVPSSRISYTTPIKDPAPSSSKPIVPTAKYGGSSRYNNNPQPTVSSVTKPAPRFGSSAACPGCHKSVSPMEPGVVPGPQGMKWHATCLVCGGKDSLKKGRRSDAKNAGCGKRLDSAAKFDNEGNIWCRECLLLLPLDLRCASPTRAVPLVPSHTGRSNGPFGNGSSQVSTQFTGTTTIARQFTGIGATDAALMRQFTGGSISPTRQGSPTKQLGMMGTPRPRPKSVIGMRSIDEGRGMYLVRQMTGAGD